MAKTRYTYGELTQIIHSHGVTNFENKHYKLYIDEELDNGPYWMAEVCEDWGFFKTADEGLNFIISYLKGDNETEETVSIDVPLRYQEKVNKFLEGLRIQETENTEEAFYKAYLKVGNNRPYVYVHLIRNELQWPVNLFNDTIAKLAKAHTIELHGGDPSRMTKQQKADSYHDSRGNLCICATWRKK